MAFHGIFLNLIRSESFLVGQLYLSTVGLANSATQPPDKSRGCTSVNIPALATGYGKLSKQDFGVALRRMLSAREWGFELVNVVERNAYGLEEIQEGYRGEQE